jgi:hypothetical protein
MAQEKSTKSRSLAGEHPLKIEKNCPAMVRQVNTKENTTE